MLNSISMSSEREPIKDYSIFARMGKAPPALTSHEQARPSDVREADIKRRGPIEKIIVRNLNRNSYSINFSPLLIVLLLYALISKPFVRLIGQIGRRWNFFFLRTPS